MTKRSSSEKPRLLTIEDVRAALQVSRWQVYQMINRGQLKSVRIDRRRFVLPEDLDALIEELRRQEGGDYGTAR
ncbi:helix-turn-helix domain-containing protein [Nocardiopsis changdeensis]|uniref:helix-turn-helix domain-containing protein n=1 Tax=Nocardiopsis changdeensis TaxID=2831969 RepID=UPI003F468C98